MGLFDDLVPAPTPTPAPGEPVTPPAQAGGPELAPEASEVAPPAAAAPAPASSGLFSDLAPGQNAPPREPDDAYYRRTGRIRITPGNRPLPEDYVDQGPKQEPIG